MFVFIMTRILAAHIIHSVWFHTVSLGGETDVLLNRTKILHKLTKRQKCVS